MSWLLLVLRRARCRGVLAALALAWLAAAGAPGAAQERGAVDQQIAAGIAALRAGDLLAAVERLREALRAAPGHAEARVQLGNAYRRLGLVERARAEYKRVLKITGPRADLYQNLGVVEAQSKHFLRAAQHFERALRLAPAQADLHYNLGNAYQELARFEEAAGAFAEALRLNPADQESAAALGNLLTLRGQPAKAVEVLRAALASGPDHAGVCYRLGMALLKEGKAGEAVGYLERAARADPAHSGAWLNLARAADAAGRKERSQEAYARFQALYEQARREEAEENLRLRQADRSVPEHYRRGLQLVNENRLREAMAEFERILALRPDDAPTLLNVGRLHAALGEERRAVSFLEKAIEADASYAEPYVDLARLDRAAGRRGQALHRTQQALALSADLGEAWLLKGILFAEGAMWQEASAALEEASRLLPANPEPEAWLAEVYRSLGRGEEAERARARAAEKTRRMREGAQAGAPGERP